MTGSRTDRVAPATTMALQPSSRPSLNAGTTGSIIWPWDTAWDVARSAWVTNLDQQPVAVAIPRSVPDVAAVVTSTRRAGLHLTAQGTGHGGAALPPLSNTVLVHTSALSDVRLDAPTRTAWIGAGATWEAVSAEAHRHGLTAQAGSAADVGVTGFLLSGGISWLARSRGLAVNDIEALEVVTADGEQTIADDSHHPELFWALRGGGGSFALVTAIKLRLHGLSTVAAGTLFFPMASAGEVLHTWNRWVRSTPEQLMTCGRLLQLPPLPQLPAPLRGQAVVAVEAVHQGSRSELDVELAALRALGPFLDTVAEISTAQLAGLHMDPPGPTPCRGNGTLLHDLPPAAIDALVACAGKGSGSPLLSVEVRQLGGALARRPNYAGALGHLDAGFISYAVGGTPDQATTRKVDAHIGVVDRCLAPHAAELQYPNLDERPDGGRARFHDPATLRRLQSVKARVDPDELFTGAHPLTMERAASQQPQIQP